MLDPQRFARGVEPGPGVVNQVMVRRLKDEIVNADGTRVPGRAKHAAIEVAYTDDGTARPPTCSRATPPHADATERRRSCGQRPGRRCC